jgi:two-component system OmpR family response regulator
MRYNLIVIGNSDLTSNENIVSTLSRAGFKVTTFDDHLEALLGLNELKPDLIILGEGLPVDNFEACRRLRQKVDIPTLLLGKAPRSTGWVRAVEVGADGYLVTPFYYSELTARVRAILRRQKQNRGE